MRINTGEDETIEVQMAPLIDCVFLLLIFFLVATTLKKVEKELPVALPDSAAAQLVRQEQDVMVLGVDVRGNLYIGAEPVTKTVLHSRLKEAAAQSPDQRVRIDADRDSRFQDIVHVLDLCQFVGLNNVGVHTRRER